MLYEGSDRKVCDRIKGQLRKLYDEIVKLQQVECPVLAPGAKMNWATESDVKAIHYYKLCLQLTAWGGDGTSSAKKIDRI